MNKFASTANAFAVCLFCFCLLPATISGQEDVFDVFADEETENIESPPPRSKSSITPFGATPEDFPANPPLTSPPTSDFEVKPMATDLGLSNFGTAEAANKQPATKLNSGPKTILKPRTPRSTVPAKKFKRESLGFEERFWVYLQANNYRNWSAGRSASTGFVPTSRTGGHGSFIKLYMNRTAAGATGDLPIRSVVVAENFDSSKTLQSISVMYRAKDFSKKSKNWYWVEFDPVGTAKTSGVVKSCIDCHAGSSGNDFAFFND